MQKLLPSEDILYYSFKTENDVACLIAYADGVVNKELLGELVARPLSHLILPINTQNGHTRYAINEKSTQKNTKEGKTDKNQSTPKNTPTPDDLAELIKTTLLFPELKTVTAFQDGQMEILDGNSLLLVDGVDTGFDKPSNSPYPEITQTEYEIQGGKQTWQTRK